MKLVLHFAAHLNTRIVRICISFLEYPLMVGSTRKAVVPGVCRNTCFWQYGADSVYDLVLSTDQNQTVEEAEAMECDAQ